MTSPASSGNRSQAALLLAGMAMVLVFCSELLAGGPRLLVSGVLLAAGVLVLPRTSPATMLRFFRAVPAERAKLGDLQEELGSLARRAGLPCPPALWLVTRPGVSAFSVGAREDAAIGLSHRLLYRLSTRELSGILAHEVAHVAAGDMTLLALSQIIGRLTRTLAGAALLVAIVSALLGVAVFPLLTLIALAAAPSAVSLLQLALSRNREFDADRGAVLLTGDPVGLAAALDRIEKDRDSLLRRLFWPGGRVEAPLLLRTHPRTEDRIARLVGV